MPSTLEVLRQRFADIGVYFLDEPEAALSFRSSLGLVALLDTLRSEGSQVVVATHSPLVASLPGATLLELGEWASARSTATTSSTSSPPGAPTSTPPSATSATC